MPKTLILLTLALSFAAVVHSDPKIYGMNLGGWLVLEPFITPGIFEEAHTVDPTIRDEWRLSQFYKNRSEVIRRHWDTWVQESDIQFLKSTGITHIRIPVGYWIVMNQDELDQYNEPFFTGGWDYVVRAIRWIKKANMKAIIDLHGAPGSQNPWPHRLCSGRVLPKPQWGLGNTINRTLEYIERIAIKIVEMEDDPQLSGVLVGLEPMNEAFPQMLTGGVALLLDYYLKAYDVIRAHLPADRYMCIHTNRNCLSNFLTSKDIIEEGFSVRPDRLANPFKGFMGDTTKYQNVILDLHTYQVFDPYLRKLPYETHLNLTCGLHVTKVLEQTLPTFTGEWSFAFKVESDYAFIEPFPNEEQQKFMRHYGIAQMKTYELSMGWFFWNFKTHSSPMWDWKLGWTNGWTPCSLPADSADACLDKTALWPTENCTRLIAESTKDLGGGEEVEGPVGSTGFPTTTGDNGGVDTSTATKVAVLCVISFAIHVAAVMMCN